MAIINDIDSSMNLSDIPDVHGGPKDNPSIGVQRLREAIPAHCWQASHTRGLAILMRDVLLIFALASIAVKCVPCISEPVLRIPAWCAYGFLQGLLFQGLWVLGHECGHGSFSPTPIVNDIVGFVVHSFFFTPYFSWQSSHRRHHIHANNLAKDQNHVPTKQEEYFRAIGEKLAEASEDAPAYVLLRVVLQQLLGWPLYILFNTTASPGSVHREPTFWLLGSGHMLPGSALFRKYERNRVIASNFGLVFMGSVLYLLGEKYTSTRIVLLYLQPYLWLNHWIVAITYLQHTHPKLPKYEPEAWTFLRGATSTVDRDFGFIDRFFFHRVIGTHVVHHIFPKIPFYHADEATRAIRPLLGKMYHEDKRRNYLSGLLENMRRCEFVAPDLSRESKDRGFWFKDRNSLILPSPIQI